MRVQVIGQENRVAFTNFVAIVVQFANVIFSAASKAMTFLIRGVRYTSKPHGRQEQLARNIEKPICNRRCPVPLCSGVAYA
jgi:hypothetical protein